MVTRQSLPGRSEAESAKDEAARPDPAPAGSGSSRRAGAPAPGEPSDAWAAASAAASAADAADAADAWVSAVPGASAAADVWTATATEAADAVAGDAAIPLDVDPVLFGRAVARAGLAAARDPVRGLGLASRLGVQLAETGLATWSRLLGAPTAGPMPTSPQDRRFDDPTWEENPAFFALRQVYLSMRQYSLDLLAPPGLDRTTADKAGFATAFLADALAPTNFLATNPAAVKRAYETGGRSLVDGFRNFTDDLVSNGGMPRQVDTSGFEVGRNLACTPGVVVYRNDLCEVLQYRPQTATTHAVPLLLSPPWINKYYVMDLAPGRSLVEWAARHGRTVFTISYRNPDAEMAGTTMDAYLADGLLTALDVVQDVTGAPTVDLVGLCLGGALATMAAAYLADGGELDRIGTVTLLNTMVDFADPGALGRFTDEETVAALERRMAKTGYLDASAMASTFNLLRPNDLIFNYVASNWLLGRPPPAFDILAWNGDSTRMPAAMHSAYLRSCYVRNDLCHDRMSLGGRPLRLGSIDRDIYVVAAVNDHIVPWASSYRTAGYVEGKTRFVLSSGGHIAGVVNPPTPKAWYEVAESSPATATQWRAASVRQPGSWWEDWTRWSAERAGEQVEPPPPGSERYPVLGEAPGQYVRG